MKTREWAGLVAETGKSVGRVGGGSKEENQLILLAQRSRFEDESPDGKKTRQSRSRVKRKPPNRSISAFLLPFSPSSRAEKNNLPFGISIFLGQEQGAELDDMLKAFLSPSSH